MIKAIFCVLVLCNFLWAVTWPAGTKAVIPITVNHAKIGETANNFLYQKILLLSGETYFKSQFDSAANITIFDTVTGLIRPSTILYTNKDSVSIYFDGATSTSADKIFFACAGPTINRTNSNTAFTNSNITNYWPLNEAAGSSTVIDRADSKNGTVIGATLGAAGQFDGCASYTGLSDIINIASVPSLNGASKFTYNLIAKWSDFDRYHYQLVKSDGASNKILVYTTTTSAIVSVFNGASYVGQGSVSLSGNLSVGQWYNISAVFDGTQSTNETRLKLYINGVQKTLSFGATTVPSTTGGTLSASIGQNAGASHIGYFDEPLISSEAYTDGRITSRSNMLMDAGTFWTQGTALDTAVITVQPVGVHRLTGETATLSVTATGSGTLSYQWYHGNDSSVISGATSSSYTTPALSAGTTTYFVKVMSSIAPDTAQSNTVSILTRQVAVVTVNPVSIRVRNGYAGSFSVTATGSGTLLYQWQRNSSNINGATSATYSFTANKIYHLADYRCIVTGDTIGDTSSVAKLWIAKQTKQNLKLDIFNLN